MYLTLLNLDDFIQKNKIQEVKNYKIPSKSYDPDGLWSETIFGTVGSQARMNNFGYINLGTKVFHPEIYDIVKTVSNETSRVLSEKSKYIISDKKLVENESGDTGLCFLIDNLHKIDFRNFCYENKFEEAKYLEENKSIILVDKFLVIPAGLRDFDLFSTNQQIDEINNIYTRLMVLKNQLSGIDEFDRPIRVKIQNALIELTDYIKTRKLTGKRGLFRGTMMSKTLDYTSRLVLANNPEIELGKIGLPWHTLVAIYEPFVMHYLFKNEKYSSLREKFKNTQDFQKFVKVMLLNPDNVDEETKLTLIAILKEFIDDQIVMVKRDPVQTRNSWFAAVPTITHGRVAYVNSVDLGPIGGDSMLGKIQVFTKVGKFYLHEIVDIKDFPKKFKMTPIGIYYRKDGVTVYDFLLEDEIYVLGLNEETEFLEYAKVERWSVHTNIQIYKLIYQDQKFLVSKDRSCFVLDKSTHSYHKVGVRDLENPNYYFTIWRNHKLNLIPAQEFQVKKFVSKKKLEITIGNLVIQEWKHHIGFDITIGKPNVRSFVDEFGLLHCNSDGDTVAVVPVFSEEAKQEVREKILPTKTKSKWIDPSSNNSIVYFPSLDAVAALYRATKK